MKRLIMTFAAVALSGCGSPSVVYEKMDVDAANPSAPPVGSITFALRTSDVTLSPSNTASKSDPPQNNGGANTGGANSGGSSGGSGGQQSHNKQPSSGTSGQGQAGGNTNQGNANPAQQSQTQQTTLQIKDVCPADNPTAEADWMKCFGVDPATENSPKPSTVAVQVTPSADEDRIYMAKPNNDWLNLHTTEFTATPLSSNDDLLLKTVTVKYSDHTKDVATAVASGVSAGAPFGPVGMAIGGAAALFGRVGSLGSQNVAAQNPDQYLCKQPDGKASPAIDRPTNLSLWLPVSISLNDTLADNGQDRTTPDGGQCWHLLPKMTGTFQVKNSSVVPPGSNAAPVDPDAPAPYTGTGWLYRIRLDQKVAVGAQDPDSYFGGATSDPKSSFPYSTCHKAHLDIVWWHELTLGAYQYLSMPIVVADPKHIGAAGLPIAGDISLHSLCGVTVTSTASTNPSLDETVNAVLAAVKTIKDAQNGGGTAAGSGKTTKGSSGKSTSATN